MKASRRLPTETFTVSLNGSHRVYVTLGYEPKTGSIREIALQGRKKSDEGSSLDAILHDLGVALSRIIQERDPDTGKDYGLSENK
jgi:hypothetical protein